MNSASLEPELKGAGLSKHRCPDEKSRIRQTQAVRGRPSEQLGKAASMFCTKDKNKIEGGGGGEVKKAKDKAQFIGWNAERNG